MIDDAERRALPIAGGALAAAAAAPGVDWRDILARLNGRDRIGADSGRYGYTSDVYDFDEPMARKAHIGRTRNAIGSGAAGLGALLAAIGTGTLAYQVPWMAPFTVPTGISGVARMAETAGDAGNKAALWNRLLEGYQKGRIGSGTGGAE
jgi:hypothetical protein